MMFCEKCGTELSNGEAFCPNCGKPAEGSQGVSKAPEKGKPNLLVVGIVLVLAMAVILIVVGKSLAGSKGSSKKNIQEAEKNQSEEKEEKKTKKKSDQKAGRNDLNGGWIGAMDYWWDSIWVNEADPPYHMQITKHTVTFVDAFAAELESMKISDEDYYMDEDGIKALHFTSEQYSSKLEPAGYKQFQMRAYYLADETVEYSGKEVKGILRLDVYAPEPYVQSAGYYTICDFVAE